MTIFLFTNLWVWENCVKGDNKVYKSYYKTVKHGQWELSHDLSPLGSDTKEQYLAVKGKHKGFFKVLDMDGSDFFVERIF